MSDRYNVLWIQTDEQRPDTLGCYGSAWARTPYVDALAASGVAMTRAFCQAPICCPSRISQLACRYPAELNALSNLGAGHPHGRGRRDVLPADTVTFPELFQQAGYVTANIGKTHTPWHPATWMHNDDLTIFREDASYTALGPGHDPTALRIVQRPGGHPIIIGGRYPADRKTPTAEVTDRSLAFLRQHNHEQPFLLRVSYNHPHTPVLPPAPFDRLYDDVDIPVRYYDPDVYKNRSRWDQAIADRDRMDRLTKSQQRQIWYDYMALAAYVDAEVGRVLAGLDNLGLRDRTIILFSSDHGRALGEWGAGEKCMFDDPVWRVPMVWNCPAILPASESRDDLCELMDIGPTLLTLAGLEDRIPPIYRGRNLFGDAPAPKAVFGQIGWPDLKTEIFAPSELDSYAQSMNGVPVYNAPMRLAVRTDRYRLDVSWMHEGQRLAPTDGNLFDLHADPHETTNLWNQPAVASEKSRLLSLLETHFCSLSCDPRLISVTAPEIAL